MVTDSLRAQTLHSSPRATFATLGLPQILATDSLQAQTLHSSPRIMALNMLPPRHTMDWQKEVCKHLRRG